MCFFFTKDKFRWHKDLRFFFKNNIFRRKYSLISEFLVGLANQNLKRLMPLKHITNPEHSLYLSVMWSVVPNDFPKSAVSILVWQTEIPDSFLASGHGIFKSPHTLMKYLYVSAPSVCVAWYRWEDAENRKKVPPIKERVLPNIYSLYLSWQVKLFQQLSDRKIRYKSVNNCFVFQLNKFWLGLLSGQVVSDARKWKKLIYDPNMSYHLIQTFIKRV